MKARNLCLSVCLSVCLKYLCRSGSDWPEIFNMAAAWFKGVQRWLCLDSNDTVNKWFRKWFTNSASTVKLRHHNHVRTRANHCRAHLHAPPPESMDNHVTNLGWRSSKTQPPWVSVSTYTYTYIYGLQTIYQFLHRVDRPSKTGLMINMVCHTSLGTLLSCLPRVWCIITIITIYIALFKNELQSAWKVSVSTKCLQAKKTTCATPFPIGGKRHHTNQLQSDTANHVIWLRRNRGKLWEGRWQRQR